MIQAGQIINVSRFYTPQEDARRLAWSGAYPLFRFSPRHLYGWRNILLRSFGAKIGQGVRIFPSCKVFFPWNLKIGNNVDIGWDVKIYNLGPIEIGSNVVISQYSHLCAGTHDYLDANFELLKLGITVGDNVWIAADAFVGPGVRIESNSVVAARSVLVHSTEANSIYAGNPARKVKKLSERVRGRNRQ